MTDRLQDLERHARTLMATFRSEVLTRDAQNVVTTLQLLAIGLRGSLSPDVIQNAEELLAAATERLARAGAGC